MPISLSTADARRHTAVDSAITEFARTGYIGTPVTRVASAAGISPAYVFKLFPRKEELFVAALDRCFERIIDALTAGAASAAPDADGDAVLYTMGGAYAELIADRSLLMLQVHAQSAADVPEIGDALRRGLARVTTFAKERSGGSDDAVQRFVAYGQLCHLIVTTDLDAEPHAATAWAGILTAGFRHP
ncbi:TetR/AcrR family transcriptional regulator [Curtobacterium sp. Leaf261]|uniref:TetR/AcrR family transcriptional regulator n=1 Tax=Curtobacterium sp. Leaf261 TaxID=1736311 RepID=UPI0006F98169|nr:TetR/AcrR family transcriptional regulator [Curtobacterium sp. Leaf261]KQO64417.1 TetR family transcriptional regulator [Curtobacterium sp. Leaf261]